ncbi:MAG: XrtA/PEP-CTERM system TPR-repeat protein PrsT, partial [Hydrogenophaga sp.]
LAVAWRYQDNSAQFQGRLQEALQLKPDHAPALIELARFKGTQRDVDGALAMLDGLLAKDAANVDALALRGDLLLYGKNDAVRALDAYRASVAAKPTFELGQGGVVRALMSLNQLDEAAKALDKLMPQLPQTLYLKTRLAHQKGDYATARNHAQQMLKVTPDSPAALEIAGAVEYQLGSLAQAESMLARAVQATPELRVARHTLVLTYLRTGQVDRALAALPPGLSAGSSDVDMLSLAGQVYMVKGEVDQAQRYFARASSLDPTDPAKRTSLAMTQLMAGKTDMALGALQDIAAGDVGVVADLALINAHMQRREADKALNAINALEKKRANDPMPLQLRGRALLMRNDRAGARAAFERALSIEPSYFEAVAALTRLDLTERKPQDAQKRLEALVAREPGNGAALLALADVRTANGASGQEVADTLRKAIEVSPTDKAARVRLIDHHLRRNDPKAALAVAQAAVAAQPGVPELVDALGRAQLAGGEYNQALSTFSQLASLMPNSPLSQLRVASVHVAKRDRPAAVAAFRKALQAQPNLWAAQRSLTDLLLQTDQGAQALTLAKSVQQQQPRDVAGFLLEGDVHASAKRWSEAVAAYQAGMRLGAVPELAVNMHAALSAAGKSAEAQQVGAAWIKAHPEDTTMLLYLGDRALADKRLPDAQRHYEQVIALQPTNALALNNLAWVAGELGREDAVALAERANAAAPNQPAFMDTLAVLLSGKNQHARAVELQKQVVQLQPNTPVFKLNLAKIQIKAGDKAAARALLDELGAQGERSGLQAEIEALRKSI